MSGFSSGGGIYDSVNSMCTKTYTIYITVTVLAPNALAAAIFGAAIFH
jgi:hypothetical protein